MHSERRACGAHRFLMEPPFVTVPGSNVKYEGVEFLGVPTIYRYVEDQ